MSEFSSSDGWVLYAVAVASRDGAASLESVVAAGDYVNHAVFGASELSDCLGRLLSAGLTVRSADDYALADRVRARIDQGGSSGQRAEAQRLVRQAGVGSLSVSDESPPEAASEHAIAAYSRRSSRPTGGDT